MLLNTQPQSKNNFYPLTIHLVFQIFFHKLSTKEIEFVIGHEKSAKTKRELANSGIEVLQNNSHIVPVIIGDAIKCKKISDDLLYKEGIYVQPINYPTVSVGTERLRFTPGPLHTDVMIHDMTYKLKEAMISNLVLKRSNVVNISTKLS